MILADLTTYMVPHRIIDLEPLPFVEIDFLTNEPTGPVSCFAVPVVDQPIQFLNPNF